MLALCLTSLILGVGLAMDACAVSMTNGLNEPKMSFGKASFVAFAYGFFQALMPMIGWTGVTLFEEVITALTKIVPYVSLVVLSFIGTKMLIDGIKAKDGDAQPKELTFALLMAQAIATSIDALATGFSLAQIAGTNIGWALLSCAIIAFVTFAISLAGIYIGKKFGDKLGNKAQILGGAVLIAIGIEIFVSGIIG